MTNSYHGGAMATHYCCNQHSQIQIPQIMNHSNCGQMMNQNSIAQQQQQHQPRILQQQHQQINNNNRCVGSLDRRRKKLKNKLDRDHRAKSQSDLLFCDFNSKNKTTHFCTTTVQPSQQHQPQQQHHHTNNNPYANGYCNNTEVYAVLNIIIYVIMKINCNEQVLIKSVFINLIRIIKLSSFNILIHHTIYYFNLFYCKYVRVINSRFKSFFKSPQ